MATRLLCGILFAFALLFLCQGSPASQALHAYSVDDHSFPENGTLSVDLREDDLAGNLLHSLSRRANARTVAEGVQKAETQLICAFGSPNKPDQANFKEEDLETYYSSVNYYDTNWDVPPDGLSLSGKTLSTAMQALNIPTKIGDHGLEQFHYQQDRGFMFEGHNYEDGTDGFWKGAMSVERGFIAAEDNRSPKKRAGAPHPPLYKQSDVYFLEWQRQAAGSKKVKNIRYFLRYHIENEDTLAIISEITNGYTTLTEWPGTEFAIYKQGRRGFRSTDEGKALLGSPNGMGVGHFLLTNRKVLGRRVPDTVRIWKTQEGVNEDIRWVHMMFHIVAYKGTVA